MPTAAAVGTAAVLIAATALPAAAAEEKIEAFAELSTDALSEWTFDRGGIGVHLMDFEPNAEIDVIVDGAKATELTADEDGWVYDDDGYYVPIDFEAGAGEHTIEFVSAEAAAEADLTIYTDDEWWAGEESYARIDYYGKTVLTESETADGLQLGGYAFPSDDYADLEIDGAVAGTVPTDDGEFTVTLHGPFSIGEHTFRLLHPLGSPELTVTVAPSMPVPLRAVGASSSGNEPPSIPSATTGASGASGAGSASVATSQSSNDVPQLPLLTPSVPAAVPSEAMVPVI